MKIEHEDQNDLAISLVVNHYFFDEEKAFMEAGEPGNHIYHSLLRLHDLINEIEDETNPEGE